MIFPKGKVIYENLNTSFTNFEELLSTLEVNKTVGYALIRFWEYEGVLFFDSGKIINAIEETENQRKVGLDAVNNLLKKATEKEGTISVYEISSELVTMLSGSIDGQILYKELTSDFTNLEKLIEKLKIEQHTGYIEIVTQNGSNTAIIFLQAGDPLESIISLDDNIITQTGIHSQIYDLVKTEGAIFNVFKSALTRDGNTIVSSFETAQLLDFWAEIIAAIEKKFDSNAFNATVRKGLLDKAEAYPFLDPFAGEFNYEKGKITFDGTMNSNFNKGIGEVIQNIIQQITDLNMNIELNNIKKSNKELIEKYELDNILTKFYK